MSANKKIISLILTAVLLFSVLPYQAFAAEEVSADASVTEIEETEEADISVQPVLEEETQIADEASAAESTVSEAFEDNVQETQTDTPSGGEAVEVEFVCNAEGTEIFVWDDGRYYSATEEGGRVYLLYPGQYDYSAYCDGYVGIDSYRFEVRDEPEHQTVCVELISSEDAFTVVFADPCIENQNFEEDFDRIGVFSSNMLMSASFAAPEYSDVASAGDALKSYLLNSDNGYLITKIYGQKSSNKGKISSSEDNGTIELHYKSTDEPTEESINNLFDDIANYAIAHTGNTHEGDYLFRARMVGLSGGWTGSKYDGTYYSWTFKFVPYMTSTVAQESAADEYYSNVLNSLNLTSDITAAQKVRKIYDWICTNIDYNYDCYNLESYDANVHSAYRGIVEKNCVCQGFATVFYRMCLECGIDARSVGIYSGHEWNIVGIDGNYYFLDSTWDEDYDRGIRYYFLRGKTWWSSNHDEKYPGNLSQYCDENSAVPCTDIYTVSSSDYTWPEEFQTFDITLDYNDGTGNTESKSVTYNGTHGELPTPARTGFDFIGWYTSPTGGRRITQYSTVTAHDSYSLYAHWTPKETEHIYYVRFNPNGGEGEMELQGFEPNMAQKLNPNKFKRLGYTFMGWKCGGKTYKDGQSVKNLTTTPGATVTMVAQWKAETFSIVFDPNGGTGSIKPVNATYDKASTKLPSSGFKKTGWVLKGWSAEPHTDAVKYAYDYKTGETLTSAQVNELYSSRNTANTVTLYAVWGPAEYKITYKNLPTYSKGSVEVLDNSMNPTQFFTQETPELTEPKVPGYTFEGWFTDSKCTKPVTGAFWTGAAKTVYAKVTPVNYTISYDLQGGAAPAKGNKTGYTIKTAVTLNNPTKNGYTFAGWYLDETKVAKLAANTYYGGDIELTARWTPNSYTLVLNGNGGTFAGNKTIRGTSDAAVTLPVAERSGYTFAGWAMKNDGTDNLGSGNVLVKAAKDKAKITLYAVWTYDVVFDANGGEGDMACQTFTYNKANKLDGNKFTRKGYTFAGWAVKDSKGNIGTSVKYKDRVAVKNPVSTLYAVWKPITYKVVFHINNGTEKTKTQTLTYDKETALAANSFIWKGHTFQGWAVSKGGAVGYKNKASVINLACDQGAEVHLYAIYEIN